MCVASEPCRLETWGNSQLIFFSFYWWWGLLWMMVARQWCAQLVDTFNYTLCRRRSTLNIFEFLFFFFVLLLGVPCPLSTLFRSSDALASRKEILLESSPERMEGSRANECCCFILFFFLFFFFSGTRSTEKKRRRKKERKPVLLCTGRRVY